MNTATGARESLVLQRFLALFLFGGAFFFGIGTIAAAIELLNGQGRAIGMLLGVGLPTWLLLWLGTVLWTGRTIPRWFIASFLLVLIGGQVAGALFSPSWMEALAVLGSVAPSALAFRSILQSYPPTFGKPAPIDDF